MPEWKDEIKNRLESLKLEPAREAEIVEELSQHLEDHYSESLGSGATTEEASRAALAELCDSESLQRELHQVERAVSQEPVALGANRRNNMIADLWQDLRFGVRTLGKQPGFTAAVILTLALGIGVNTAFFTLFGLAFRPAPAKDSATIVDLGGNYSYPDYAYFRDHTQASFSGLIARTEDRELSLGDQTSSDESQTIRVNFVTDNFFSLLGAKTTLGRAFAPEENGSPGQNPVVVLSHSCWQSRFGGDPKIIGQTLRLNGVALVVIGVASPDFIGVSLDKWGLPDAWAPLMMRGEVPAQVNRDWLSSREIRGLTIAGSLKPGRTWEEASAQVNLLARQHSLIHPLQRVRVRPCHIIGCSRGSDMWTLISVVMMATTMVLLIACSNIANLMLARGAQRQKEIGVRLCLGASRGRVIRQLLTESLLLACLGGAAGLLLAWWGLRAFMASDLVSDRPMLSATTPYLNPDLRVLTYTFLLSLLTGVAFGLAPALRATRSDLVSTLKAEDASFGRRMTRSRLRSALVVAQVAFSLMLLIGAGLLLRGILRAGAIDPGLEKNQALIVNMEAGLDGYDPARAQQLRQELVARLEALPGVLGVSQGSTPPTFASSTRITLKDKATVGRMDAGYKEVTPNYFETVGLPIVRGRGFTEEESRARAPVVVVTESTARLLWPNQEPLGQFLRPKHDADFAQVIGVARDDLRSRYGRIDHLLVYLPLDPRQMRYVMLRTTGDARAMKSLAQAAVKSLDPHLSLRMISLEEVFADDVSTTRVASYLASGLGLLALILAAVGIYGVMAYSVTQRTREIGIRAALGAQGRDVLLMLVGQGLRLVGVGIILGVAGGAAVSRVLSSLLFGLSPFDPIAYAGVSLFLVAVSLLAIYLPARQAASADPMVALRYG